MPALRTGDLPSRLRKKRGPLEEQDWSSIVQNTHNAHNIHNARNTRNAHNAQSTQIIISMAQKKAILKLRARAD